MQIRLSQSILAVALIAAPALAPMSAQAQGSLLTSSFGGTQATGFTCPAGSCITLPQQVGINGYDVTLASTGMWSRIGDASLVPLGFTANGYWSTGTYAKSGGGAVTQGLRFTFAQPVYAVGAWMNYATANAQGTSYGPVMIRAYGQNETLLDEFDLSLVAPINTPNGVNEAAFRGIQNLLGIYAFEIGGSYVATQDLYASSTRLGAGMDSPGNTAILLMDDPPVTATPEPSTYALMACGLTVITAVARRRARRA